MKRKIANFIVYLALIRLHFLPSREWQLKRECFKLQKNMRNYIFGWTNYGSKILYLINATNSISLTQLKPFKYLIAIFCIYLPRIHHFLFWYEHFNFPFGSLPSPLSPYCFCETDLIIQLQGWASHPGTADRSSKVTVRLQTQTAWPWSLSPAPLTAPQDSCFRRDTQSVIG